MADVIEIFYALVNGIPEWRVYVNYELKYKFATKERADRYVKLHNKKKKK